MKVLPTDTIIFGILARATAQTVGRCKSVCKEWYALLSATEFEIAHGCRPIIPSEQRTLIIDVDSSALHGMNFETGEYDAGAAVSCPFTPDITNISVLSHLDGLLCVWVHGTHALFLWNPTTTRYMNLATSDEMGIYLDSHDTIGLYKHPIHDYKVLHIRRLSNGFDANIYSRETTSWRNIHFNPDVEYIQRPYYWSPATQCGKTLYFAVYNSWDLRKKTIVCFDIITEQVAETQFPPVESSGVFVANLITIQDTLHMFVSTGVREMLLQLWVLRGEEWINAFSSDCTPRIPVPIWGATTHYMTNGVWFVMSKSVKVLQLGSHGDPVEYFHCVSSTQDNVATLYLQTLVSPTLETRVRN